MFKAKKIKPRIRYVQCYFVGYKTGMAWMCESPGREAIGRTPTEAYKGWRSLSWLDRIMNRFFYGK